MNIKDVKIASIIVSNTLVELIKDIISSEIDKGEQFADFTYVDLMVELNEILTLHMEMTDKRL